MFKKFNKSSTSGFLVLSLVALIFVTGFGLGYHQKSSDQKNQAPGKILNAAEVPEYLSKDVNFKEFWQVWQYVKDNYVKSDVTDTKLFYGALAGMVASLQDPYSVFLSPETAKKFEEEIGGSFEGIGAEIGLQDNLITVIAPLPGTPAQTAGLRAGDKILAIDGKDTSEMALDYAVGLIRGPKGTTVKLTILSTGDKQPKDITVTRDQIEIDSVKISKPDGSSAETGGDKQNIILLDNKFAYIQLLYFNENTLADWDATVQKILLKNPQGIILDLRNNPGGLLQTAIEISGDWIDGKTVVSERVKNGDSFAHQANRRAVLADIPTVVLINKGSASGSEIVAGALQDYKVATLVGETTFGKGSVQDLKQFSDGSSVKLTIAEWFTPNGRNINKEGIKPDVEVKMTQADYDAKKDPQLDKALEILKGQ